MVLDKLHHAQVVQKKHTYQNYLDPLFRTFICQRKYMGLSDHQIH
jgi:hypothetical protein